MAPGDTRDQLPGNQLGDDAFEGLGDLLDRWRQLDEDWSAYLAELHDSTLNQRVNKVSSLTGKRAETTCQDVLLHVCTHAQYTTAQLMNMLRHTGKADLPDVMLITMARNVDC